MTKEDIKQICQIYDNFHSERDVATIAYNSDDTFWEHILATYNLSQPSLPSDLDEAAIEAYPKMSRLSEPHGVIPADNKTHYLGDANEENRVAFKAGAEWMAGLGASFNTEVGWIDGPTILNWPDDILDKFEMGDKVIVQIRKKQ